MKTPVARSFPFWPYVPWGVLVLGLVLSLALWVEARRTNEEKTGVALQLQVAKVVGGIEARVRTHEQMLRGVAGFLAASRDVRRSDFKSYVQALRLDVDYPGAVGVGLVRVIPRWLAAGHVAAVHKEGYPNYRIYPESNEDLRTSIVFLETVAHDPQDFLGYDMYTDPVRQAAMRQARDGGQAVLSSSLMLLPGAAEGRRLGSLLFFPVYRGGSDPGELLVRRNSLESWVYSPLNLQQFFDSLLGGSFAELSGQIAFSVREVDEDGLTPGKLLYRSGELPIEDEVYVSRQPVFLAGRTWLLEGQALPAFVAQANDSRALLVLLGSVLMTLLVSLFLELRGRHEIQLGLAHLALERSRNELQNIYDTTSAGIFMLDPSGRVVHANRFMAEMFALPLAELVGTHYELLVAPEEREAAHLSLSSLLQGERLAAELERLYLRRTGEIFVGRVLGRTVLGDGGEVEGVVGVISDITEQRRNEVELRIAAIAFESSEAMVVTDRQSRVVKVNHAFSELTGYSEAEVIGRNIKVLASGRHSQEFYKAMWQEILEKGSWQGEIWNRHKNGTIYPQWQTITAVRNGKGETTNYVSSGFDISRRVAQDTEMRNLAFYDPLTGLANRRLFDDRLRHAFAKSSRNRMWGALIFIDLDHFKELNDLLGHAEGDRLLQSVADRLSGSIREGDTVARLGGDEFVMLLEDLDEEPEIATRIALDVAEGLRLTLNAPHPQQERMPAGWRCTPSIGVALFFDGRDTTASVIERADKALYAAKSAGRNTVCLSEVS